MSTNCSNTQPKSVEKLHDYFVNELWNQIIPFRRRQQISLSVWQCWSAYMCIFDSILALYTIHDNPLAYQSGSFSVIFT